VAPEAKIVATGDDAAHEQRLRDAGADFVIAPHTLIAEELAFVITGVLSDNGSRFTSHEPISLRGRNAFERGLAAREKLKRVA
jgi:hypothetical protein